MTLWWTLLWLGCDAPTVPTGDSDSAPPIDTPSTRATGDTADTGDTGEPPGCTTATFTAAADGRVDDLTGIFTTGDFHTLDQEGTLAFCPGTWFVRLTVTAPVTVLGLGDTPEDTVLSGGESGTVLTAVGSQVALVVEGVTLDRGATDGIRNEQIAGGLTCGDSARVRVVDAVLSHHYAYDGAAIFAKSGCVLELEGVSFSDNEAEDDGGAVRVDTSTGTLTDVSFSGGEARDCGGLFAHESDVAIDGATFSGNLSRDSQGGAILHYYGTLSVRDAVFETNEANGQGGALSLFGDTVLEQVSFVGNRADTGGGAIYLYPDHGTLTCTGCSFADNQPDDVGVDGVGSYVLGEDADFTCDSGGCG